MRLPRLTIAALLLSAAVSSVAQDVIMSQPAWVDPRNAPQELPQRKGGIGVRFPDELKATTDIGYVVFQLVLDEKGQVLSNSPHTTLAMFQRLTMALETRWNPGKRDGKGVNTETTYAYIFNPASAAEKGSDATPRLLEVTTVNLPAPKNVKGAIPDRVEMADVSVDEKGLVTAVKNAPAALEKRFEIAVKNWRFAPARRGGIAVPAEVRMPFIVVTGDFSLDQASGAKRVQPKPLSQVRPDYPFAMLASGMKGEVIVDFIVDIEGRVRDAYAVRSLNPSFDDPAVEAVMKWRFEPGKIGGRPVNTHMQVPVVFTIDDRGGGTGPLKETKKPDLSKLPEQFRYDTAPRPVGTARVVYPYELLKAKKEGKAVVRYVINQQGQVVQVDVGEATTPEMGLALQAAVECFVYEPALKGGKPGMAVQAFAQQFDRDEKWQIVSDADLDLLKREEKKPESIVTLSQLDEKLVPKSRRPPQFPLGAKRESTRGEAMIEFLVDEDGRVRLPRVVSASEPAFGYAAVQAVSVWRFEPPKRGGKATVVRVQVPIVFGGAEATPRK